MKRLSKGIFKYKFLLKQLISKDLKEKYQGSFLGYLWSFLSPLLIMLILTFVFSTMFKKSIQNYPVYLLAGRTLFEFMTQSTNKALSSVVAGASLIKKAKIPKVIFPITKITSTLVDVLISLVALLIVMLITQHHITWYILFAPFVLLQLYIFCLGLGFMLSQAYVFFKDVRHIYAAMRTAWLYLTPVFYPISMLPNSAQWLISMLNPMYIYIEQFRNLVYEGCMPEPFLIIRGVIFAVLFFGIGLMWFRKKQDKFILHI